MGVVERVAMGIVLIGFATTLILPDRQTTKVLAAGTDFFTRSLKTAMGRA
jgi:hypothetical protein